MPSMPATSVIRYVFSICDTQVIAYRLLSYCKLTEIPRVSALFVRSVNAGIVATLRRLATIPLQHVQRGQVRGGQDEGDRVPLQAARGEV